MVDIATPNAPAETFSVRPLPRPNLPALDPTAARAQFAREGFLVVRGLFRLEEVEDIRALFAAAHARGVPGLYEPGRAGEGGADVRDPLNQFPRVMHPHRWDRRAREYLVHGGVRSVLAALFGCDPVAAQSMYYFKPPGARGQAMHQDNFYLLVDPGTCIAAWTAIDDCDPENGCMYVVPGTQGSTVSCPETADTAESFTSHLVRVPSGMKAVPCVMKAGDTLFFNGSLLHGSGPNRSADRFRRSFICHYASGELSRISHWYLPLVDMDGRDRRVEANKDGGPCGSGWQGAAH
jgi:phytanoyl-CoA hydroxylase